ncbi:MAG: cytochrome c peroxidase [Myxococcota bacterium]
MRTSLFSSLLALALLAACKAEKPAPAPAAAPTPAAPAAAPAAPATPAGGAAVAAAAVPTPLGLPELPDSADNPTTAAKVALGHALFFDKRLSKDDSMACVGCHLPDKGWATPNPVDAKVGGGMNKRNAPNLQNVGYHRLFYWDGRMPTLEAVSNAAWKGQLGAEPAEIAKKLNAVAGYQEMFQKAFNAEATADNIPQALAAFLRTLKNGESAFDRFTKGEAAALTEQQQRGWKLFQETGCMQCHVPPLFTDTGFHNVGIGMEAAEDKLDKGRTDATKDEADKGKFKTPSLRDAARTGPYFHDGSAKTLEEAITVMAQGGKKNPNLDPLLKPHDLKPEQVADLKAFIEGLNGKSTYAGPPASLPQ